MRDLLTLACLLLAALLCTPAWAQCPGGVCRVPVRSARPAAARQSVSQCQGGQCNQRRVGLFGRLFGGR